MINNPLPENRWERKSRLLTQVLIISGALNIGLLASFCYFALHEKETAVAFDMPPISAENPSNLVPQLSNEALLQTYATMSYAELLALLDSQESVEAGYKKRDIALASLTAFHFFNLEKAAASPIVQRRMISFIHREGQEKVDIAVFPGLTEEQFQAIIRYAKTEKWPFTAEGLFFEIQHANPRDPSLLEAFYLTDEFRAMMTLFTRVGIPLPQEIIVDLLTQGDWRTLQEFVQEQKSVQDLTPLRLKTVLHNYLRKRSLLAAKILLQWDHDFIIKRLEDVDLLLFLDLFSENSPALDRLLKELLGSQRSDAIWRKAAEKLYAFHNIPIPDPYTHEAALHAFLGGKPPIKEVAAPGKKRKYVVQAGDSLWKIAKKHKVSIEALRKKNRLEGDKLRVGKEIEIPE